jgi:hypothetical protein
MPSNAGDPVSVLDDGTAKTYSGGGAATTGMEDTFLRTNNNVAPSGQLTTEPQRLFDVPGMAHPYQTTELMTKIFGNLTNRSNVFAVWMTVGFFQVVDPTVRPVKLGPEIGASTGSNIRHQIFAVLDRTQMNITTSAVTQLTGNVTLGPGNQPNTFAAQVAALKFVPAPNAMPWSIQPGTVLSIDQGTANEETVVVQAVAAGPPMTFTATFTKPHGAQATVNIPGNPGPQSSFSVTAPQYQPLILTYTPS